jgi:hypothetical protein
MKITSSFFLIVSFFASIQFLNADQSYSHPIQKKQTFSPLKTAWEHKKKIIAVTITAAIGFCFFKDQATFKRLDTDFFYGVEDEARIKAANALADFTHNSWFIFPYQKRCVYELIDKHRKYFFGWGTHLDLDSGKFSFYKR